MMMADSAATFSDTFIPQSLSTSGKYLQSLNRSYEFRN